MPCDGTSDGEGADDVSDTDSGGVDVNKLCSRANPLVHYFGFRKLGLAPVALAVGCLLFMLVAGGVIAILVEFPVATPYVLPPGKISTGAIHPHTYILLTFYLSAITLFAAFCALVRGRDRGADLEALVLTRLKPSEIVFGLLRIPAIILPACVGVWHFAMLWWIKIQYPHVIESYGQGRGPENTYSWLFAIAGCHLLFTVYWIVTGWCAGGLRGLFMRRASFLLITPFVLLTLSNRVLLGGYFDVLDGLRRPMYFVDVPSRWILAWMGFFGLCSVALIGIRRQLIPLFMRAANPEEAIRTFWQSREEAAEEYPNDLAAARARMMDVVRES
jgi:hypothetical protein